MVLTAKRGRWAAISLKTQATDLDLVLSVDGIGEKEIYTNVPVIDELLKAFVRASRFDLDIEVQQEGEPSLTVVAEDIAKALGQALRQALGDEDVWGRCGDAVVSVGGNLFRAVVELSPSAEFYSDTDKDILKKSQEKQILFHFFETFCQRGKFSLHLDLVKGTDNNEAAAGYGKACGAALKKAIG